MSTVSSDALERITSLAATMGVMKARVEALDQQLKDAKEDYRRIEREDLPELMRELGLSEVRLADGTRISVDEDVECSITEMNRAAAHAWLNEKGFGGIIKSSIVIDFGRNEIDEAHRLANQIEDLTGRPVGLGEKVHPQTLKAFVKEQLAAGNTVPFDIFSIHPFPKAKLVAPKK